MWVDHYLVFETKGQFEAVHRALDAAGAVVDDIGVLYRSDTGEISDGYHVNVRLETGPLPAGVEVYQIEPPSLPKRLFMAG